MNRRGPGVIARYLLLGLLALLFLLPYYLIVRNAFSTELGLASPHWQWLPDHPGLANLRALFANQNVPVLHSLGNSAIVSITQTVLTLLISAMAGYGLARIGHRAAQLVLGMTLLTLMVPATVTFVPTFVMVSSLGWISSFRGLIVPVVFSPFATYLFRQYFLSFPRELEEAAEIDGAGYWRTFWQVVMPNTLGISAAIGTITFIGAWNAFLWPLLIGQDSDHRTIQVTLSQFLSSQRINLPQLFSGALVAVLPVLGVFLVLQRYLVQGVERSGID